MADLDDAGRCKRCGIKPDSMASAYATLRGQDFCTKPDAATLSAILKAREGK